MKEFVWNGQHDEWVSSSPIRSPIMTHGAIVLPVVITGMMEPSAMRSPSIPCTRSSLSTTAIASCPILQVQVGCPYEVAPLRMKLSRSSP